jgi:CelD/BcsL family acetyltransferase involved in cellulose biosynthesis
MVDWKIYPIDVFDTHKHDWDRLNASSGNTPLLDSRFVGPLLGHFGNRKEILAICTVNGDVCCMVIVVRGRFGVWETFQPSQAPIGCWVQDAKSSTTSLGISLRQALPGASLILGITQQDPDLLPRPERAERIDTVDYITTARIAIDGSFDEYWSQRGKNLRQNLRRQRNRLGRENVDIRLDIISDSGSVHNAVEQYGFLESAGWKSESNTAVHIDNTQGKFYEQMLRNFAESGQTVIFQYHYDDALVATDLCIIGGGALIILKTTYDETITTNSPAMLMREDAFKHVFAEQLAKRIEFYGKVMEWHTKWADDVRNMYHINVYSRLGALIKALRQTAS